MANVTLNDRENAVVNEYGFRVVTKSLGSNLGNHFMVVDPKLPKKLRNYVGPDVWTLLCEAIDGRAAHDAARKPMASEPAVESEPAASEPAVESEPGSEPGSEPAVESEPGSEPGSSSEPGSEPAVESGDNAVIDNLLAAAKASSDPDAAIKAAIGALMAATRAAEKPAVARAAAPKPVKKQVLMKKLFWADPWATFDEYMDELEKLGHNTTISTLQTCRADFYHSIRVLHELGQVSDETLAHVAKK